MTRARHHYMADFFYPEAGQPDGFRKQSHRIVASSDSEAIKESELAAKFAQPEFGRPAEPAFFRVRKVFRKGEETIFDSSKVSHA